MGSRGATPPGHILDFKSFKPAKQDTKKKTYSWFTFFCVCVVSILRRWKYFRLMETLQWKSFQCQRLGRLIYILDSSNSSSFIFWSSKLPSSSRCNWTSIRNGNSNGSWTDKHSSHSSTAKEISVKATFFFM